MQSKPNPFSQGFYIDNDVHAWNSTRKFCERIWQISFRFETNDLDIQGQVNGYAAQDLRVWVCHQEMIVSAPLLCDHRSKRRSPAKSY